MLTLLSSSFFEYYILLYLHKFLLSEMFESIHSLSMHDLISIVLYIFYLDLPLTNFLSNLLLLQKYLSNLIMETKIVHELFFYKELNQILMKKGGSHTIKYTKSPLMTNNLPYYYSLHLEVFMEQNKLESQLELTSSSL